MEHRSAGFRQVASTGILLVAALIWGMCFVAQRSGMEHIGPFLFNGIRSLLGSMTILTILLLVLLVAHIRAGSKHAKLADGRQQEQHSWEQRMPSGQGMTAPLSSLRHPIGLKYILAAGVFCGIALYFASNLQQIGLVYVTASKSAFITTLYIVLVPVLGLLFRQRARWNTWVSVVIAVVGLYMLCMGDSNMLELGDAVLLAGALFWAIHILAVGHYAPRLSFKQLLGFCVAQFMVSGVLSFTCAPLFDHLFVAANVTMESIALVAPELLYAGILSTGGAFTLAAIGQRYAKPAPAAIVMSTESVFGLLGGVVLLGEALSFLEGIGCILMLAAVILTQLDFPVRKARKRGDPAAAY